MNNRASASSAQRSTAGLPPSSRAQPSTGRTTAAPATAALTLPPGRPGTVSAAPTFTFTDTTRSDVARTDPARPQPPPSPVRTPSAPSLSAPPRAAAAAAAAVASKPSLSESVGSAVSAATAPLPTNGGGGGGAAAGGGGRRARDDNVLLAAPRTGLQRSSSSEAINKAGQSPQGKGSARIRPGIMPDGRLHHPRVLPHDISLVASHLLPRALFPAGSMPATPLPAGATPDLDNTAVGISPVTRYRLDRDSPEIPELDLGELDLTTEDVDFDEIAETMGTCLGDAEIAASLPLGRDGMGRLLGERERTVFQLERRAVTDYISKAHLMVARYRLLRDSDMVLAKMQGTLDTFNEDLRARNTEIAVIIQKENEITNKSENRRMVQSELETFTMMLTVSRQLHDFISDAPMGESFLAAVGDLHNKLRYVRRLHPSTVALGSAAAELNTLRGKAGRKVRDHLLGEISRIRKLADLPGEQETLLQYQGASDFLQEEVPQMALEVRVAYVDAVHGEYARHFRTLKAALHKMQYDEGATRADLLALDEPRRGGIFSPARIRDRGNVFSLGSRGALLADVRADPLAPSALPPTARAAAAAAGGSGTTISDLRKAAGAKPASQNKPSAAAAAAAAALASPSTGQLPAGPRSSGVIDSPAGRQQPRSGLQHSHTEPLQRAASATGAQPAAPAVPAKGESRAGREQKYPYEALFKSFHLELLQAAIREHNFCEQFFGVAEDRGPAVFRLVMDKVISSSQSDGMSHVDDSYDAISITTIACLSRRFKEMLGDGVAQALRDVYALLEACVWKRLNTIVALHVESVRQYVPKKIDVRPHNITRRFAEMSSALLQLAASAVPGGLGGAGECDSGTGEEMLRPKSAFAELELCLGQLQDEVEVLIMRASGSLLDVKEQLVFLINNYDLIYTLWEPVRPAGFAKIQERLTSWQKQYTEEVLSPYIGSITLFNRTTDSQRRQNNNIIVDQAAVSRLVDAFADEWKAALKTIDSVVTADFVNFKRGTEVKETALTLFLMTYGTFVEQLKKDPFSKCSWPRVIGQHEVRLEAKRIFQAAVSIAGQA